MARYTTFRTISAKHSRTRARNGNPRGVRSATAIPASRRLDGNRSRTGRQAPRADRRRCNRRACRASHDRTAQLRRGCQGRRGGLSASTFTARHGFETLVLDAGESILRRNAHLENFPGFPAGVNARHLLDLLGEQAETAGADRREGRVTSVAQAESGFTVETADGDRWAARYVVAATKNGTDYLREGDGVEFIERGKNFVDTDEGGTRGRRRTFTRGGPTGRYGR